MQEEEEIIKRIEDFLDGSLDEAERLAFLEQCKQDKVLDQQLTVHRQIRKAIQVRERRRLKSHFKNLDKNIVHYQKEGKTKLRYIWAGSIAASLLIACAFLFMLLTKSDKNYDEIFTSYYKPFPGHLINETVRGSGIDNEGSKARKAYEAGDYETAEVALRKMLKVAPRESHLKLYLAICYLEMEEFTESEKLLKELDDSENAYQAEAKWYLALLYLKIKDLIEAKKYLGELANENGENGKKAELILNALIARDN